MSSGRPKLVILDLDNTCISAVKYQHIHNVPYHDAFRHIDLENIYRIFQRPGLQEWLDHLFSMYKVGVWTAAGLHYALFVVSHFITKDHPHREIEFIMWDQHCNYSARRTKGQTKQITLLEPLYDIKSTVLLDDNTSVLRQTSDTIDSIYFDVLHPDAHMDTFCITSPQIIQDYFENKSKAKYILKEQLKKLLEKDK